MNSEKLEAAKQYLGARWVNHPAYRGDPRHSTNPEIYVRARQPYLQSVVAAAQRDREANPAFLRAQRLSASLSQTH